MTIYVEYTQTCLASEREDCDYGSWYSEYQFSVDRVSLTKPLTYNHEKFGLNVDLKAGDPAFVLTMIYSSGDSFGTSRGNGEVLWVFKDAATALAARDKWMQQCRSGGYVESVEFNDEIGNKIRLSNPAAGYFENMSDVIITTMLVNP